METRVEKRYGVVYAEIKMLTDSYIAEIQKRGKALLSRLDTIHNVKMAALAQQKRELSSTTVCLAKVSFGPLTLYELQTRAIYDTSSLVG